ncbi:ABC transporter substrate-binding protein [Amnibacterium setariae]|uniref:ABC transporter substrate-binding protein n=1 Tax=Amnibacterium setariae TaxID=2306585 RepID=A0A3A1TUU9_9MICO|nr:ABC transporter substrate-binding protein [Amnibacterium setariae]RIX28033.1 ABC transporter substrate-binding protein [Amnibacterium setariae]
MHSTITRRGVVRAASALALAGITAASLAACSGSASGAAGSGAPIPKASAAAATSAEDFGGLKGLEAAANAEGRLNVITLPPSWANYGKIIAGFEKKYPKITITSQNPNGSSADEVAAIKAQGTGSNAPDVVDIGTAVLDANKDLFTPYKVANWADIPADYKDADGLWYYDYTGLMSIGYDSSKVKAPTSLQDLLGSEYKGKVAIKGDPTQANEAASAVYLAAAQSGGSADDVQPGIDFFGKLKKAGNMISVLPTQATVNSGQTPVVIQWSFNNVAWGAAGGSTGNPNWKTVVLPGTAIGSYYNQSINKNAPNPAAARLWEEYIYSPEVQNLYLAAGAYPATLKAMTDAKTVDEATLKSVGEPPAELVQLTADQATKAASVLKAGWSKAIG